MKRLIVLTGVAVVASAALVFGFAIEPDEGDGSITPRFLSEVLAKNHQEPPAAGQETALEDGVVSMEEYNVAMAAYAACGESAGFTAISVESKGLRPMHVSFQIPAEVEADPDQVVRDADAVLAGCRMDHLDAILTVWELQKEPPTDAEVEALYEWMDACLDGEHDPGADLKTSGGGYYPNAPQGRTFDIDPPERILYLRCAAEAEALTGLDAPPLFTRPDGLPARP